MLKIWFRELPSPVLNAIPKASIFNATDQDNCIQAYQGLPEMERTLLDWLIDLLMTVAAKSHINKMTIQNLGCLIATVAFLIFVAAIVVAPNLYNPPGSDPIEGLVLSQKCVQFLHNILLFKTGIWRQLINLDGVIYSCYCIPSSLVLDVHFYEVALLPRHAFLCMDCLPRKVIVFLANERSRVYTKVVH